MRTLNAKGLALVLIAALAVCGSQPVDASQVRDAQIAFTTTDVTLTTTTETVIVSSGAALTPFQTSRVIVIAWGQLTTGTGTTAVTPRIRRGTAITGTLVGEALAEQVKAAAGSSEPFVVMVSEERSNTATVEYSLTLQQTAATGNGTAPQAAILVLVL